MLRIMLILLNVPKQLEGGTFLSLSPGLIYDTRDTTLNPRDGVLASVRFDEAVNLEADLKQLW